MKLELEIGTKVFPNVMKTDGFINNIFNAGKWTTANGIWNNVLTGNTKREGGKWVTLVNHSTKPILKEVLKDVDIPAATMHFFVSRVVTEAPKPVAPVPTPAPAPAVPTKPESVVVDVHRMYADGLVSRMMVNYFYSKTLAFMTDKDGHAEVHNSNFNKMPAGWEKYIVDEKSLTDTLKRQINSVKSEANPKDALAELRKKEAEAARVLMCKRRDETIAAIKKDLNEVIELIKRGRRKAGPQIILEIANYYILDGVSINEVEREIIKLGGKRVDGKAIF